MFSKEFIAYVNETIPLGNRMFANDARVMLVHGSDKQICPFLNFEDDLIFLEPFAITYFTSVRKEMSLAQTYFKHLPPRAVKAILTDDRGIAYIPELGYFSTEFTNSKLTIKYIEKKYIISKDNKEIEYNFIPSYYLQDTNIEVALFQLPYSDEIFKIINPENSKVEVENITQVHLSKVIEAFKILEINYPDYYQWLLITIKRIQIFENKDVWSFASVGCYGISFLSAHEGRSILFFLEDLIHQCAHNIFYAISYHEKDLLFDVSPKTIIDSFAENSDHRELYSVFSGLFTQSCISVFFDICLERNLFYGKEKMELVGRLSDNMKRWKRAIELFSTSKVLDEMGEQYFEEFRSIYEQMNEKYYHLIYKFDTSNQPYIFCFETFYATNKEILGEHA